MSTTVIGCFATEAPARVAACELIINGFARDRIRLRKARELIRGDQGRVGLGGHNVEGFMGRVLESIFLRTGLLKVPAPLEGRVGSVRLVGIEPDDALVIVAADDELTGLAVKIFRACAAFNIALEERADGAAPISRLAAHASLVREAMTKPLA